MGENESGWLGLVIVVAVLALASFEESLVFGGLVVVVCFWSERRTTMLCCLVCLDWDSSCLVAVMCLY